VNLNALAHEIGVFDLNSIMFYVYLKGNTEPIKVELKDELIVQILMDQPTENINLIDF